MRILGIASRDRSFAQELMNSEKHALGPFDAHMSYASLAEQAISLGDYERAKDYILHSLDADPTQIPGPIQINALALHNRQAADKLILEYINRLNNTPLTSRNGSLLRTHLTLNALIHPESSFPGSTGASAPGPAVMKAYVIFIMNSVTAIAQQTPSSVSSAGNLLQSIYPLLKQYAPELTQQFLDLELRSRRTGESFSLPSDRSVRDAARASDENKIADELKRGRPDENIILTAISREDFASARKMIDKWDEGPRKVEFFELADTHESLARARKGGDPERTAARS